MQQLIGSENYRQLWHSRTASILSQRTHISFEHTHARPLYPLHERLRPSQGIVVNPRGRGSIPLVSPTEGFDPVVLVQTIFRVKQDTAVAWRRVLIGFLDVSLWNYIRGLNSECVRDVLKKKHLMNGITTINVCVDVVDGEDVNSLRPRNILAPVVEAWRNDVPPNLGLCPQVWRKRRCTEAREDFSYI